MSETTIVAAEGAKVDLGSVSESGTFGADDELMASLALISPKRAAEIHRGLSERFRSVSAVLNASDLEIETLPGIKDKEVKLIKCMGAIHRRAMRERMPRGCRLSCMTELTSYLHDLYGRRRTEALVVLLLDSKSRLIRETTVSEGTVDYVPMQMQEILRMVVLERAAAVILAHNHPTGDPTPSEVDRIMTNKLIQLLTYLKVQLYDHVIVGDQLAYSLQSEQYVSLPRHNV